MQAQSTSSPQLHGLSSRTAVTHEQADPQQVSGVLVAPEPLALLGVMTASHDLYDAKGSHLSLGLGRRSGCPLGDLDISVRLPLRPREPPLPASGTQLTGTQARLHVYPRVAAALPPVVPTTRLGVLHRWP